MWEKVRWRDVLEIRNGKNQSKVVDPNGRYPIYGSGGIMGYANEYLCPRGSTIIGRKGSINNPMYIDEDFWNVDTAFGLVSGQCLDRKFLYYFCLSYDFKKHDKSTTLPSLTKADLLEIKIPLPPLPVQQRIADMLDKADALRRKDQELLKKYDELAQAIFIDMFGDPVKNEKGWSKDLLKKCYKKGVKCGPFGSALKKEEFRQEGIPVWNMDNIQAFDFVDSPNLFVSKDKYSMLKQYEVLEGDIIISRAGTVGKMCVVNSRFKHSLLSTNLIRLSLDDSRLIPLFFVHLMKYFSRRIGRLKTGSDDGFTHMNTKVLDNIEIYLPPLVLQQAFVTKIELINQLKVKVSAEKSEELFQGLLQAAFKEGGGD